MKNIKKIIIINFCLALIITAIVISGAAYTSMTSAKRVISKQGATQLFSSNILSQYEDEENIGSRALSLSTDEESSIFKVTVCNYAQGDKTKWPSSDITYTFDIKLLKNDNHVVTDSTVLDRYLLDGIKFSDFTALTKTLSKDEATEDVYTITVPTDIMKDYKIKITAVPSNSNYLPIGRYISVSEYTANASWKLAFFNVEMNENAYDLGAINTKISGQEHAKFTLRWDASHVDIDPWFLNDMGIEHPNANENGWCEITFEVGGVDAKGNARPNQYNVIFYRTYAAQDDDEPLETWDNIKSYITYKSVAIAE